MSAVHTHVCTYEECRETYVRRYYIIQMSVIAELAYFLTPYISLFPDGEVVILPGGLMVDMDLRTCICTYAGVNVILVD